METVLKGKLVASKVYDSAEPVKLRFELTNKGAVDLYALKWYTPLEGLNSDCLKVIRNEKNKVAYDGPMVKRGHPGPEDYLLVPAGETVSADVNVSESYAVSLPADYRVELNIAGLEHLPAPSAAPKGAAAALAKDAPQLQELTGGGTSFKVKKGAVQLPTRGRTARKASKALAKSDEASASDAGSSAVAAGALLPTLVGGMATQKDQVRKAHTDGFALCEAALGALANDARYQEWFGAHTAARFKKVTSVYTKVRDRMKSVVFTYDLSGSGCQSGWFAYTHKGDTTIWLCGSFWVALATGTDSKAGTIVHEHTHSDADTDDVTYGQTNARAFATSNPNQAVKNADNYEYYAGG
jgi:peptidyl-Lys metalloendopeptidase